MAMFTLLVPMITLAKIPEHERQALIDLYEQTDGDNWDYKSGWLSDEVNECDWYGITCSEGGQPHVIIISLYGMSGDIPESIGNLSYLERLMLEISDSSLPESIGQLSNLEWLSMYTYGKGMVKLPESIGDLSSLDDLYLAGQEFTELPETIGQLKNLRAINLEYGKLEKLPDSIVNLSSLSYLGIKGNRLTELPDSLQELQSHRLYYLDVFYNKIDVDLHDDEFLYLIDDLSANSDWRITQTVPPELNSIVINNDGSFASISWYPIQYDSTYAQQCFHPYCDYSTDYGKYRVLYQANVYSDFILFAETNNVTANNVSLEGLPKDVYRIALQTLIDDGPSKFHQYSELNIVYTNKDLPIPQCIFKQGFEVILNECAEEW